VLDHPDGYGIPLTPDNTAGYYQLHGRGVVQQDRPGDRELHVQSDRQRTTGIEEDAAARKIYRLSLAGVEYFPAADQLPSQIERRLISPVVPAIACNSLIWFYLRGH
jgi:hypothetical protein